VKMRPSQEVTDANTLNAKLAWVNSDLVFTGQLTGCSFVIKDLGGQIACTHIQPAGGAAETGRGLQERLTGYKVANTTIFGAKDYGVGNQALVIGQRSGTWSIFAQIRPGGGSRDIDQVWQIFPRKLRLK